MVETIISKYAWIFGRPFFEKLNKLLLRVSLSGLGYLNYRDNKISGELAFLKMYIPGKNGAVLDVGANDGEYSSEILRLGSNVTIYAFEPHPITFRRLLAKFSEDNKVYTINGGLSCQAGQMNLYDYSDVDGSEHASLYRDVITEIHRAEVFVAHEVNLQTLDEFVNKYDIGLIDLLKIDTEGNELAVLRGANEALRRGIIKAIHFEFNEMNVISRCYFKDFWDILTDYNIYRLLPNGMLRIKKYSPLYCEIYAYQNIVAILKD